MSVESGRYTGWSPLILSGTRDPLLPSTRHPSERIHVAFSTDDSNAGVEELSWGQCDMWLVMSANDDWMPIGGTRTIESGTSMADIIEELRYSITRFPCLRTKLRQRDSAPPSQELFTSGEIVLEVFDTDTDSSDSNATFESALVTPEAVAAAIEEQYQAQAMDFGTQWPVRMAVVRSRGELTHMVALVSHLALDASGAQVMLGDVARRNTAPISGMQPTEQARWQRSPAGVRQNAAALRYWENLMRSIPPSRTAGQPRQSERGEPDLGYWSAEFTSPALLLSAQIIAGRTDADLSAALLAFYAVAMAEITGIDPVVARPLVNNRFRPSLADVACTIVQGGIVAVSVKGATVDEIVLRAARATMSAYKNAYYDPMALKDLIDRITQERGAGFEIGCFYNDRRSETREARPPGPADHAELTTARERSAFRWMEQGTDDPASDIMFLHIDDAPDALILTVRADAHYFPPRKMEALVRGMETVAVAATFDGSAPAETCPAR